MVCPDSAWAQGEAFFWGNSVVALVFVRLYTLPVVRTGVCHILAAVTGLLYSLGVTVVFLWLNGPCEMVQVSFMLTLALGFYYIFWRSPPLKYQKSVAIGFGTAIAGFVLFVFPWLFFAR